VIEEITERERAILNGRITKRQRVRTAFYLERLMEQGYPEHLDPETAQKILAAHNAGASPYKQPTRISVAAQIAQRRIYG
jgi:hypothetical protein